MSVFMCENKSRTSGSFSQGALMFVHKMKLHFDVWRLSPDKSHGRLLYFPFGSGDAADPKHRSQ